MENQTKENKGYENFDATAFDKVRNYKGHNIGIQEGIPGKAFEYGTPREVYLYDKNNKLIRQYRTLKRAKQKIDFDINSKTPKFKIKITKNGESCTHMATEKQIKDLEKDGCIIMILG